MIDLDRTMFFKAKFDVSSSSGEDVLWSVVMSLREWSKYKARRDGYSIPDSVNCWSKLKYGNIIKADGAEVELFSAAYCKEGVYTWACQHIETVHVLGLAPRRWITEVGFEGHSSDRGSISIITMYSDAPGFLGPLQEAPSPSIPAIIRYLIKNTHLVCSSDGRKLPSSALELSYEDIDAEYDLLANPERQTPVILVSPSSDGDHLLNPEKIYRLLGPNARVLYAKDFGIIDTLNSHFRNSNLRCFEGSVRIYAPNPRFDWPEDSLNHRFFSARVLREKGPEYHYEILRRALAEDVHARDRSIRVEDVKQLNLAKRRAEDLKARRIKFQDATLDSMSAMFDEAETRANKAEDQAREATEENANLRQELNNANALISTYKHALKNRGNSYEALFGTLDESVDLSLTSIARLFVNAYPDRLDFSKRGWHSLESCTFSLPAFWYALHSMCTVLYPLYAKGDDAIVYEYNNQTRLQLKMRESELTEGNAEFMRQREDMYQGRRLFIEPHIASSTGDVSSNKYIRIYFNMDKTTGRLVIGDTHHLDIWSTSRR